MSVLVLAGPTASGKSHWALPLAQRFNAEIISMDSALVYQGMDIGTAKPSAHEQAQVPHHVLDMVPPSQSYSAARFARDAQRAYQAIRARGKRVLVVGGTMLYHRAWLQGLHPLPPADPAWRQATTERALALGWPALHAELVKVDPITAKRLAPHDSQRIQRALEVWHVSGKPLSQWHAEAPPAESGPASTLLSLEPSEKPWLLARIEARLHAMLQQGFLQEMRQLMHTPGLHPQLPAMRCVGYRQAWQLLNELGHEHPHLASRWLELAAIATRQLAKRQLTWLRSLPQRVVVAADAPDVAEQLMARAQAHWSQDHA